MKAAPTIGRVPGTTTLTKVSRDTPRSNIAVEVLRRSEFVDPTLSKI